MTDPKCAALSDVNNGKVEISGYNEGDLAWYFCHDGYYLDGNEVRECLDKGNWTGSDPTCESKHNIMVNQTE